MSRARAVEDRVDLDAYQTPPALAREIVAVLAKRLRLFRPEIIEPSAGTGAFVRACREQWPAAHITAVDVDSRHEAACVAAGANLFDAREWTAYAGDLARVGRHPGAPPRRLIVGNPPYREAEAHVEAGLRALSPGEHLAFLLRLNLLGSRARVSFWKEHPATWIAPVVPRPSFTGTGSDATEYAVFCWRAGRRGTRVVRPVVWAKRRAS